MRAEINVLGSLEVAINGVSVVPTASKPRQLLAMLAINTGRLVTMSALMDELWGDDAPSSAVGTLQTYVMQIRKLIRAALPEDQAPAMRDILVTMRTGYLLQVEPEMVDAVRYTRLASAGRVAGAAGDYLRAEQLLSAALAIWRGPVLVDLVAGPQLRIDAMRLAESRLADMSLRIDACLHLGRHHQLIGELAALCARNPYMENFRAQYLLALYRSGRQGQALEVYREMWTTIRGQLGVSLSPQLRELHQAILTGDTAIDSPEFMVNTWVPETLAG